MADGLSLGRYAGLGTEAAAAALGWRARREAERRGRLSLSLRSFAGGPGLDSRVRGNDEGAGAAPRMTTCAQCPRRESRLRFRGDRMRGSAGTKAASDQAAAPRLAVTTGQADSRRSRITEGGVRVPCRPFAAQYHIVTLFHADNHLRAHDMTTYGIRDFKARVSEVLRDLEDGEEVIITRRGEPCGRLIPVEHPTNDKPSLASLRGALADLPDATYEDFRDIKAIWEPRAPASGGTKR